MQKGEEERGACEGGPRRERKEVQWVGEGREGASSPDSVVGEENKEKKSYY